MEEREGKRKGREDELGQAARFCDSQVLAQAAVNLEQATLGIRAADSALRWKAALIDFGRPYNTISPLYTLTNLLPLEMYFAIIL